MNIFRMRYLIYCIATMYFSNYPTQKNMNYFPNINMQFINSSLALQDNINSPEL